MARLKKIFTAVLMSAVLSIVFPQSVVLAAESNVSESCEEKMDVTMVEMDIKGGQHPECNHGDLGFSNSTMYVLRIQYLVDEYGKPFERWWYRCQLCGYERYVDIY